MAKNLKLTIKNTQIAQAINLSALKNKLADKKGAAPEEPKKAKAASPKGAAKAPKAEKTEKAESAKPPVAESSAKEQKEEAAPKIRARSRSAFAERTGEVKPPS